jgi:hypothetical protein
MAIGRSVIEQYYCNIILNNNLLSKYCHLLKQFNQG